MNRYLTLTFIFIGVWFVASLINGILSGIIIGLVDKDFATMLGACVAGSFIFSIPFVGLVWLIAMAACLNENYGAELYRIIFQSSFWIAFGGAILFIITISGMQVTVIWFLAAIILSAVSSILIFRKQLKAIK